MLPLPTQEERRDALLSALSDAKRDLNSDLAWEVMTSTTGEIANRAAAVVVEIEDKLIGAVLA